MLGGQERRSGYTSGILCNKGIDRTRSGGPGHGMPTHMETTPMPADRGTSGLPRLLFSGRCGQTPSPYPPRCCTHQRISSVLDRMKWSGVSHPRLPIAHASPSPLFLTSSPDFWERITRKSLPAPWLCCLAGLQRPYRNLLLFLLLSGHHLSHQRQLPYRIQYNKPACNSDAM